MISPELRRAFAVGEAKKIWRLYGLRSPTDLVLEDLAMAMGVVVIEDSLDSADAWLLRKGKKGLIRVKKDIPQPGRKRFAIAHEIGHWRLHEQESQILACTDVDMRGDYKGSDTEIEANHFASELLMPGSLFRLAIKGSRPAPDLINGLASQFGTTRTATAVRFVELSEEPCAMIISYAGKIKWWRASKDWQGPLWISSGKEVSPRTLAGMHFSATSSLCEVRPVALGEWAQRFPDEAEDAMEAIIPLGATGAVLTTLWVE